MLAYEIGSRGVAPLKKLLNKIAPIECEYYASDYWKAYPQVIPRSKLVQSKAETYTVEGVNSRLRGCLARLNRRTKRYSKSLKALSDAIFLLLSHELYIY